MKGFQCDSKCTKLTIHPTGHPNESFNVHMHPSDSTKLSLAMPDETKQVHISRAPTIGLHAGLSLFLELLWNFLDFVARYTISTLNLVVM